MKVSEIPVQTDQITPDDIKNGYTLGMKNVYPQDKVPVYEMQQFPLTAYLSDIDMNSTKQLIQRMRTISSDVIDQKEKLENIVNNIKTVTLTDISAANLQLIKDTISYDDITSQLSEKFANPDELKTVVDNVYSALFAAVEEMIGNIDSVNGSVKKMAAIRKLNGSLFFLTGSKPLQFLLNAILA